MAQYGKGDEVALLGVAPAVLFVVVIVFTCENERFQMTFYSQLTDVRGKTGQACQVSGVYAFDGYLDGTSLPRPHPAELREPIAQHNVFPPIRSAKKGCWWKLVERA